jgi:CopC domain
MSLVNTIARGTGADIVARTDANPKSKAIVNAEHSNYATVQIENGGGGSTTSVTPAGTAGNQTSAPAFVNAAAGDFHELSSSLATIDQGVNSPLNGTTDLDGNPRQLGASTDIGAYELIPPPTTPAATTSNTIAAAPVALPLTAPVLSNLSETAKTWREGNALAHITAKKKNNNNDNNKKPVGTTFSFGLNEPASVTLTFTEPASGRKAGKTCVTQTKKNKKKKRCTRTVTVGTLTFTAHTGTNKVHFEGLISKHKKLRPGSYTLMVTATASGKHSTTSTLHFTIAR